jgi:hypothetical protein
MSMMPPCIDPCRQGVSATEKQCILLENAICADGAQTNAEALCA